MTETIRFRVDKLIRDKLPGIMRASGLRVFDRRMDRAEFIQSLKTKLLEESAEVSAANTREEILSELADVIEVVISLAKYHNFTIAELEACRVTKLEERGCFEDRIYNAAVEADEGCAALAYYLARPDRYPRL